MDGLELDEEYLLDTNNWASHWFLQILYKRMLAILGDENAVYKMTIASERFQSLGLLDRMVRLLGNPKLLYSQAPTYNKLLKLNGDVLIREMGDNWVILEDRYHESRQKTRFDCDYTRGILTGIPTVFGLPLAEVEELECQVATETYRHRRWPDHPPQGRQGCLYRVQWSPLKIPYWKRLFQYPHIYQKAIEDLQNANALIQKKYWEVQTLTADLKASNRELTASQRQLEANPIELKKSEERYRLLASGKLPNPRN